MKNTKKKKISKTQVKQKSNHQTGKSNKKKTNRQTATKQNLKNDKRIPMHANKVKHLMHDSKQENTRVKNTK